MCYHSTFCICGRASLSHQRLRVEQDEVLRAPIIAAQSTSAFTFDGLPSKYMERFNLSPHCGHCMSSCACFDIRGAVNLSITCVQVSSNRTTNLNGYPACRRLDLALRNQSPAEQQSTSVPSLV